MSNVTVVFHTSLLPYTGGTKKVEMTPDSVYFLFLNCLNLFPDLEKLYKKGIFSKLEDLAIVKNKRYLSSEEFLFLAKESETYYLVPIFKGSDPSGGILTYAAIGFAFSFTTSLMQGASFGQALLRGVIGAAASAAGAAGFQYFGAPVYGPFAESIVVGTSGSVASYAAQGVAMAVGSILQNTLVPIKPKARTADSADSGDRPSNDAFDGQINTISSSQSISLNYGMIRVSGQIISADVNTISHGKSEQIKVADYV